MNSNTPTLTDQPPNGEPSRSTTEPRLTVERHSEFFFDDTLVAIQIENTLFNVHKYQLLKSETFSDMFRIPNANDGQREEGSSPEHPIIMQGVKSSDFVAFLRFLYPSQFSTHQLEPEPSLIVPAYRIANMWNFSDLRVTLFLLAETHLNDVDKILFAKEFDIRHWLAPAHLRLCRREEQLTTEEARNLGVDSLLLIARMREQNPPKWTELAQGDYCFGCSGFSVSDRSSNSSRVCQGCHGLFYNTAHYFGGGRVITGIRQDFIVENEVEKWVQDGCAFVR